MEHLEEHPEIDRRSLIMIGLAGAAGLLANPPSAAAQSKELAPGVTLKVLKEGPPIQPIAGFKTARLMEITWQPGAKLPGEKATTVALCEIVGAPLYSEIEGMEPFTLQPGDFYACPVGQVETVTNKGDKVAIMRIMELDPA